MPLYVNNEAAIAMVSENQPTLKIQHFAIQERCVKRAIVMKHIPWIVNPSDDWLVGFLDAARATSFKARESVTGYLTSSLNATNQEPLVTH